MGRRHAACWWHWSPGAQRPTAAHLDDDGACLLLLDGGYVAVRRATGTAVVHTRRPVPAEDVVHPYLAGPAGIFAHWEGWMAFHAGAVVHGGGAWALLGDKGAGKTTTLAHLDDRGVPVLTDDLLVTDGVVAHPGPHPSTIVQGSLSHSAPSSDRALLRWLVDRSRSVRKSLMPHVSLACSSCSSGGSVPTNSIISTVKNSNAPSGCHASRAAGVRETSFIRRRSQISSFP